VASVAARGGDSGGGLSHARDEGSGIASCCTACMDGPINIQQRIKKRVTWPNERTELGPHFVL
jgi:hypothetical protein